MSAGTYRIACGGCKKTLKLELSDVPDADFQIDCPKCKSPVFVRAAAVKAAIVRPGNSESGQWIPAPGATPLAQPQQDPTSTKSSETLRSDAAPEEPPPMQSSRPSETARSAPAMAIPDSPPMMTPSARRAAFGGTEDVTDSIRRMNEESMRKAEPELALAREEEPLVIDQAPRIPPPPVSRGVVPGDAPRMVPTNAPRTTPPRAPAAPVEIPWRTTSIVAGTLVGLIVLTLGVKYLWNRPAKEIPSTVESDGSVDKDIAAFKAQFPDPGGTAADLYAQGLALLASDATADHRAAAEKFRRAVAADAKDPRPLAAIAIAEVLLPRSDREGVGVTQANQWADFVQRKKPDAVIGTISRAMLLASLGRDADAQTLAHEAATKAPDDPWAAFAEGWAWRKADPVKAAAAYRRAAAAPGFKLALSEVAAAELAAGRLRAAELAIDARVAAGGSSSTAERVAGSIASVIGDDGTAKKRLAQAVSLEPKDVEARLALAAFLARAGDAAGTIENAKHVLDVDRASQDATEAQGVDATLLLARGLRMQGKLNDAIFQAREALKGHASRADIQYELALALFASNQPSEAGDVLREAAIKNPNNTAILTTLGFIHHKAGHLGEALNAFQQALANDPDAASARVGLAMSLVDADSQGPALDELGKLVEITHPVAMYLKKGDAKFPVPPLDVEAAMTRLRTLEQSDANRDQRYRVWEGSILALGGRVQDGAAKIAATRPGDSATLAWLAGWQMAAGRPNDAVRSLTKTETAREITTRAWALRAAKSSGDDPLFLKALALDPHDVYASLGHAANLAARGKKPEAKGLLDVARPKLALSPTFVRVEMAVDE